MEDLIKALQIFAQYTTTTRHPTNCSHDTLWVNCVDPADIPEEEIKQLDELGFFYDVDEESFISYRFGSN